MRRRRGSPRRVRRRENRRHARREGGWRTEGEGEGGHGLWWEERVEGARLGEISLWFKSDKSMLEIEKEVGGRW